MKRNYRDPKIERYLKFDDLWWAPTQHHCSSLSIYSCIANIGRHNIYIRAAAAVGLRQILQYFWILILMGKFWWYILNTKRLQNANATVVHPAFWISTEWINIVLVNTQLLGQYHACKQILWFSTAVHLIRWYNLLWLKCAKLSELTNSERKLKRSNTSTTLKVNVEKAVFKAFYNRFVGFFGNNIN